MSEKPKEVCDVCWEKAKVRSSCNGWPVAKNYRDILDEGECYNDSTWQPPDAAEHPS